MVTSKQATISFDKTIGRAHLRSEVAGCTHELVSYNLIHYYLIINRLTFQPVTNSARGALACMRVIIVY